MNDRRKLRRFAVLALAMGVLLGLLGLGSVFYGVTYYSGRGLDIESTPSWVGPLTGFGEFCLVAGAPLCFLVGLATFLLSFRRGE